MLLGFCVIFRTVRLLAVVLLIGLYDPLGDGFGVGFFVLVQQLVVLLVVDEPQLDEDAGHLGLAQDVVAGGGALLGAVLDPTVLLDAYFDHPLLDGLSQSVGLLAVVRPCPSLHAAAKRVQVAVDGDKVVRVCLVGALGPLAQIHVLVLGAGQDHLDILLFQVLLDQLGHGQRIITLVPLAGHTAAVVAAVAWVDADDETGGFRFRLHRFRLDGGHRPALSRLRR